MPSYITQVYYLNEYKGTPSSSYEELEKTIKRSCDVIDLLTNYVFVAGGMDFETSNEFIKTQVKKAVCALVEHYIIHGGYDSVKQNQGVSNTSIGSLNFSTRDMQEIPDLVFVLLFPTGLMYNGLGVM